MRRVDEELFSMEIDCGLVQSQELRAKSTLILKRDKQGDGRFGESVVESEERMIRFLLFAAEVSAGHRRQVPDVRPGPRPPWDPAASGDALQGGRVLSSLSPPKSAGKLCGCTKRPAYASLKVYRCAMLPVSLKGVDDGTRSVRSSIKTMLKVSISSCVSQRDSEQLALQRGTLTTMSYLEVLIPLLIPSLDPLSEKLRWRSRISPKNSLGLFSLGTS